MRRTMPLTRRDLLTGAALGWAGPALASGPDPSGAQPAVLMIAGPSGGRLDRWADTIGPAIGRSLRRGSLVHRNVGGLDGVTGANQFEAQVDPDGNVALLVPGSAALSWLAGETRARFDPARWVPLWATSSPVVLVSRFQLTPGKPLLLAGTGLVGPDLPAVLALDLMGVRVGAATAAAADAVLLQGAGLAGAIASAQASGFEPVMTFGVSALSGEPTRDALLPSVPTAFELVRDRASPEMLSALRAVTLAVELEAALVLPQLTPAASVAAWRRASAGLLQDGGVIDEATRLGSHLVSATDAASCTSRIAGDPRALLALRAWLSTRPEWHPG